MSEEPNCACGQYHEHSYGFSVVPVEFDSLVSAAIDKGLEGRACDEPSRKYLEGQLRWYFANHGHFPDFEIKESTP